ncbi:MAG: hypothetical protein KGR26_15075, partial [Cyanobacteria bacterium REEB65]|nr:hypothetical protein [Cyanobacteria bacterium REEB65]
MSTATQAEIESVLKESRIFEPPASLAATAHIRSIQEYEALYDRSVNDPEGFWAEVATQLHWFR